MIRSLFCRAISLLVSAGLLLTPGWADAFSGSLSVPIASARQALFARQTLSPRGIHFELTLALSPHIRASTLRQAAALRAVRRAYDDTVYIRSNYQRPIRETVMQIGTALVDRPLDGWLSSLYFSETDSWAQFFKFLILPARMPLEMLFFQPGWILQPALFSLAYLTTAVLAQYPNAGPWILVGLYLAPWIGFKATVPWIGAQYILPGSVDHLPAITEAVEEEESWNVRPIIVLAGELGTPSSTQELTDHYVALAHHFPKSGLKRQISIKLSAFDKDFRNKPAKLVPYITEIAKASRAAGVGLTIDGEQYLDRAAQIQVFEAVHDALDGWEGLGIVVQTYFKDSTTILQGLVDRAKAKKRRLRIRLVKGAYYDIERFAGHPVWLTQEETDKNFRDAIVLLMDQAHTVYPMVASMNVTDQAFAFEYAQSKGLSKDVWESQILFGMQGPLIDRMLKRGQTVSVYMLFGTVDQAVPYFGRRRTEITSGHSHQFWNRNIPARQLAMSLFDGEFETVDTPAVRNNTWWGRLYWNVKKPDGVYHGSQQFNDDAESLHTLIHDWWSEGRLKNVDSPGSFFTDLADPKSDRLTRFIALEVAPLTEVDPFLAIVAPIFLDWARHSLIYQSLDAAEIEKMIARKLLPSAKSALETFQTGHAYKIKKAHDFIFRAGVAALAASLNARLSPQHASDNVKTAMIDAHRTWNEQNPQQPAVMKKSSADDGLAQAPYFQSNGFHNVGLDAAQTGTLLLQEQGRFPAMGENFMALPLNLSKPQRDILRAALDALIREINAKSESREILTISVVKLTASNPLNETLRIELRRSKNFDADHMTFLRRASRQFFVDIELSRSFEAKSNPALAAIQKVANLAAISEVDLTYSSTGTPIVLTVIFPPTWREEPKLHLMTDREIEKWLALAAVTLDLSAMTGFSALELSLLSAMKRGLHGRSVANLLRSASEDPYQMVHTTARKLVLYGQGRLKSAKDQKLDSVITQAA